MVEWGKDGRLVIHFEKLNAVVWVDTRDGDDTDTDVPKYDVGETLLRQLAAERATENRLTEQRASEQRPSEQQATELRASEQVKKERAKSDCVRVSQVPGTTAEHDVNTSLQV
jgi:hypothetical protein